MDLPQSIQIAQIVAEPITEEISEPTPETEKRYKCHTCYKFFFERYLVEVDGVKQCPNCGETFKNLEPMCKLDHNHCGHDVTTKIAYCPECKKPVCPECGCHDVEQISRVTGYLQAVNGWNKAKQQELRDRSRFNLPQ
jgi:DNA-directed RNA polymerase subunit RPC12/RpoP